MPNKNLTLGNRFGIAQANLDITSSFGLMKTPLTATTEEIDEGIVAGATDDSEQYQNIYPRTNAGETS
jgi:hypothetical protein